MENGNTSWGKQIEHTQSMYGGLPRQCTATTPGSQGALYPQLPRVAVSSSITAPQYYSGRFNPKKLYRGCGVRHSSEDILGDKISRTSPFGGTTLHE